MIRSLPTIIAVLIATSPAVLCVANPSDAFCSQQKKIIDDNPGDAGIARNCLVAILTQRHISSSWRYYADDRIKALQRMGAIPQGDPVLGLVSKISVKSEIGRGSHTKAMLDLDRMIETSTGFSEFMMQCEKAMLHADWRSPQAGELYHKLAERIQEQEDGVLSDSMREYIDGVKKHLETMGFRSPIDPLVKGRPFRLMHVKDFDKEWAAVPGKSVPTITPQIDRVILNSTQKEVRLPWSDRSGGLDGWHVMDYYLKNSTPGDLEALRAAQTKKFSLSVKSFPAADLERLELYRRYPWAVGSQKMMMELANRYLWSGKPQSALRCYLDVSSHSKDATQLSRAQAGQLLALASSGNQADAVVAFDKLDPDMKLPWMGTTATVAAIRKQLGATSPEPAKQIKLSELKLQPVNMLPVPPVDIQNNSNASYQYDTVNMQIEDDMLLLSDQTFMAAYKTADTQTPIWAIMPEAGQRRSGMPGLYHPQISGDTIYARRRLTHMDYGIASINRLTGETDPVGRRTEGTVKPMVLTDPVEADKSLFYLKFQPGSKNAKTMLSIDPAIKLVCADVDGGKERWALRLPFHLVLNNRSNWSKTHDAVINAPSVTVKDGCIYVLSHLGFVTRHDIRTGRIDWHQLYNKNFERRGVHPPTPRYGARPLVVGNKLICVPRDSSAVFALDLETGRLVWENTFIMPLESPGVVGDSIILRSKGGLTALDVNTGKVRWHTVVPDDVIDHARLVGRVIVIMTERQFYSYDASTGALLENRSWDIADQIPRHIAVKGDKLFVVTDMPGNWVDLRVGDPLNPDAPEKAPAFSLPAKLSWTKEGSAEIHIMKPGSPLAGKFYRFRSGMIECCEISAPGRVLWHRFSDHRPPQFNFIGSVVVLYESYSGELVAFDGFTGRRLWAYRTGANGLSVFEGFLIDVNPGSLALKRIDPKTGKIVWAGYGNGGHRPGSPLPQLYNKKIHTITYDKEMKLIHTVINPADGKVEAVYKDFIDDDTFKPSVYPPTLGPLLQNGEATYHYGFDGKKATRLSRTHGAPQKLLYKEGPYVVFQDYKPKEGGTHSDLHIYSYTDPDFYFGVPTTDRHNFGARMIIKGDRLMAMHNQHAFVVDLKTKKYIFGADAKDPAGRKRRAASAIAMQNGRLLVISNDQGTLVDIDSGKVISEGAVGAKASTPRDPGVREMKEFGEIVVLPTAGGLSCFMGK